MATVSTISYPTSDGKPMAETDLHRVVMIQLIETLTTYFAAEPQVYVSGNLLLFYEEGNHRRHVSPDVFVVKGIAKRLRPNYLLWEEGKGPDVVMEITSSSTRSNVQKKKFLLYQDTLKVEEYFLFDPLGDYLDPPLRGFRLVQGVYEPIGEVKGRVPSKVLGLHLERSDTMLRLYDPVRKRWLATADEEKQHAQQQTMQEKEQRLRAEQEKAQADALRLRAEQERAQEREQRLRAEQEKTQADALRLRAEQERAREREQRLRAEQEKTQADALRLRAERETDQLRQVVEGLRRRLTPDSKESS